MQGRCLAGGRVLGVAASLGEIEPEVGALPEILPERASGLELDLEGPVGIRVAVRRDFGQFPRETLGGSGLPAPQGVRLPPRAVAALRAREQVATAIEPDEHGVRVGGLDGCAGPEFVPSRGEFPRFPFQRVPLPLKRLQFLSRVGGLALQLLAPDSGFRRLEASVGGVIGCGHGRLVRCGEILVAASERADAFLGDGLAFEMALPDQGPALVPDFPHTGQVALQDQFAGAQDAVPISLQPRQSLLSRPALDLACLALLRQLAAVVAVPQHRVSRGHRPSPIRFGGGERRRESRELLGNGRIGFLGRSVRRMDPRRDIAMLPLQDRDEIGKFLEGRRFAERVQLPLEAGGFGFRFRACHPGGCQSGVQTLPAVQQSPNGRQG